MQYGSTWIPDYLGEFDGVTIDEVKARCHYLVPPPEFDLKGDIYDNPDIRMWHDLSRWWRAAGVEDTEAMCVYLSEKMGITLDEAAELDTQYGHAYRDEFDRN